MYEEAVLDVHVAAPNTLGGDILLVVSMQLTIFHIVTPNPYFGW